MLAAALAAGVALGGVSGAAATEVAAGTAAEHATTEVEEGEAPIATIVVTATRTATRLDEATTSITVIDEDDIRAQQAETVLELLRKVAGVDLVQNGSRGTAAEIFVRGAEADQTLVLIDGVEVNSVTLGAFDFANLTTDNVERIEVLRGAGGTLYGSQAVGGVVNVVTRRGRGAPSGAVSAEGGSGSTARGAASTSGQIGRLGYSVAGAYLDTEGFRSINDDYRNGTASLRLDYDVTERAAARLFFRYTNAEVGLFNSNNFLAAPDPNARTSTEFYLVKGEWEQEVLPDLELRLAASYTHEAFEFVDPPDAAETSLTTSDIPTGIVTGELQANHYFRELLISTVGLEVEERMADVRTAIVDPAFELRGRFDESRGNVAGYAQEQVRLLEGRLILIGGVRVDGNEDFGTEVSPAGSASYLLPWVPGLRVKAGYAEGFKAPTFNELFFPGFGNPDLDAETSREWNAGLVQSLPRDRGGLEVTFFDRKTDGLIEGTLQDDGSFLAENRGEVRVRGVEVIPSLTLRREPDVTFQASYTRLETVEGDRLLRRPKDRGSLILNVAGRDLLRAGTRYHLNLALRAVGDRVDVNPGAGFAFDTNPAYTKVDVAASYTFERALAGRGDLTLFVKVENVLDEDYQEALGFRAPPANALGGVRASF
jgi:vitamin B12 transporter